MKKLLIFALIVGAGCTKEVTQPSATVKTVPVKNYILSFGVEPEKNASYVIQKLQDTSWVDIATIPDTSLTGNYKVKLPLQSKEQLRVKGIDETVTFSAVVGAE